MDATYINSAQFNDHVKQLKEVAVTLSKSGMSISEVTSEIYSIIKVLIPQNLYIIEYAKITAALLAAVMQSSSSKPPKEVERK